MGGLLERESPRFTRFTPEERAEQVMGRLSLFDSTYTPIYYYVDGLERLDVLRKPSSTQTYKSLIEIANSEGFQFFQLDDEGRKLVP